MPAYQFTAIDAAGKQHKGVLEGDSARQIRQQLRDKAWTPIAVDAVEVVVGTVGAGVVAKVTA